MKLCYTHISIEYFRDRDCYKVQPISNTKDLSSRVLGNTLGSKDDLLIKRAVSIITTLTSFTCFLTQGVSDFQFILTDPFESNTTM